MDRLDVLIYVTLDQRFPNIADKILKLSELGLNSGEIGAIVNRPPQHITATLSKAKKRKKRASKVISS